MSDNNEMQDHLNNAVFGPRKTNPDERRHYLGSLRERVGLLLTNHEMGDSTVPGRFAKALPAFLGKDFKVLINGRLGTGLTAPYVRACAKSGIPFTLISDESSQLEPDAVGLLVVATTAINREDIALAPVMVSDKPKKGGLFGWFS